jgi:D-glycero-alpha-D-manno-heptose 1-phosphate guanylyltransferase
VTSAVILAGGLGTRLSETVPNLPKPMAPISGRPFLEILLDYWIDQGINDFIISVSYLSNIIIEHFGSSYRGIQINYSIEDMPLGTGGGLLKAVNELVDPVLVINGDTFIEVDLNKLLQFHVQQKSNWTFSLIESENTNRYMDLNLQPDGKISFAKDAITEYTKQLANGGAYIINPLALKSLNFGKNIVASLENELLLNFISSDEEIYGLECHGRFIDIGIPADYRKAQDFLVDLL